MNFTNLVSAGIGEVVEKAGVALNSLFTSDEERLKANNVLTQIKKDFEHKSELLELQFTQEFNNRVKALEGSVDDLKAIPFIGSIIIFLRGTQRPTWGYSVLFMDYMVFSKQWNIEAGTNTELAFLTINFLVLGFLFGERAIKNILPLVNQFLVNRSAK